jgi:hypothetical protein
VFLITDTSDPTQTKHEQVVINQWQPDGTVLNNVTVGEYDVVITDQPLANTFEDTQYRQAIEMRKEGVGIPDSFIVQSSSLSNKGEIVKALTEPAQDPLIEAKKAEIEARTAGLEATAERTRVETVNKSVESVYSASQAANVIASVPATAPIADALLLSSGFQDRNQPPVVPQGMAPQMGLPELPKNTSPLFPARISSPINGLNSGIEGGRNG